MWLPSVILLLIPINQISAKSPPMATCSCAAPNITNGIDQFTSHLYQKCANTTTGNVIISPFSVFNALALLAQGAGGQTFQQLATVLGTGNNKKLTATQFKAYYDLLNKAVGNSTFSLANEIYVQTGYQLNQQYEKVAVNQFMSGIEQLNFADATASAQVINQFVDNKTDGKIQNLISPDMLSAATRLFLVNAIYFKGEWLHQFDVANTYQGNFTTKNSVALVDFMTQTNHFNYGNVADLDATALELQYAYSNLSFVILLPNNPNCMCQLSKKLQTYTASDYAQITQSMHVEEVHVTIPKFTNKFSIGMNDVLAELGLNIMFTDSADFSGLLQSNEPLKVSNVVHQAYMEINEEGTVAAAATGVGVTTTAIQLPQQFIASK